MSSLMRSMAMLALLPTLIFDSVAASPASQPQLTPLAHLEERANGANIIGFSSSGTGLRTRSCDNGFFSSSGTLGNCCASASCTYITACRSSYLFYAGGGSASCRSAGVCGTGLVLKTVGDSSPLSVFNCESNWRVTATLSTSSTSSDEPSTVTSIRTTGTTATVISSVTQVAAVASISVTSSVAQLTSTATSSSEASVTPVTLTVTNSQGQQTTQVTLLAAGASGIPSSSSTATVVPLHNNSSSSSNTGPIAGGVVGGIAVIVLAALGIFFLRRKSKQASAPAPANHDAAYFAPAAGGQQSNESRFSQIEFMNNPPAMAQSDYQQNQAYSAYAPPIVPVAQQSQQDYKYAPQQDVETTVVPAGPLTPMAHPQEVYGSPVPPPGSMPYPVSGPQEVYGSPVFHPVEMPAHAR
ncbi:hypothetical protein E2P81_ATG09195 [Venturia nashicola]|nr:hypothetical protein E2P81_ATG09195 [Venturia nashicola]